MKSSFVMTVAFALFFSFWPVLPAAAQGGGGVFAAAVKEAAAKPTPRAADGHPDLTGYWAPDRRFVGFDTVPIVRSRDGKTVVHAERDAPELDARAQPNFKARAADASRRPPYKP